MKNKIPENNNNKNNNNNINNIEIQVGNGEINYPITEMHLLDSVFSDPTYELGRDLN